jgi:hypothetical protein
MANIGSYIWLESQEVLGSNLDLEASYPDAYFIENAGISTLKQVITSSIHSLSVYPTIQHYKTYFVEKVLLNKPRISRSYLIYA